jgi:DNA-binding phage protein
MAKAKISPKRKKSSSDIKKAKRIKKNGGFAPYDPIAHALDENFVSKAIFSCLKNNDPEGIIEIISEYLDLLNKVKSAQQADLPRSTMYHSLKQKNPTVKTLAKLVSASVSAGKK